MKWLFKDRIKPIVIIQLLLICLLTIIFILTHLNSIKDDSTFFRVSFPIFMTVSMLLNGIENLLLKKKLIAIIFFIFAVCSVYLLNETFRLYFITK